MLMEAHVPEHTQVHKVGQRDMHVQTSTGVHDERIRAQAYNYRH